MSSAILMTLMQMGPIKKPSREASAARLARVDITFEMATGALMALAGPFVLFDFSTYFPI